MKMLHFALSEDQKSRKKIGTRFLSVAAASLLLSVLALTGAAAQDAAPPAAPQAQAVGAVQNSGTAAVEKNSISKVSAQRAGKRLEIEIHCARMPEYTDRELPGSGRKGIVVDIANAEISSTADLTLPEEFKVTLSTSAKTDTQPPRMRFEFSLPEPYVSYAASLNGYNVVLSIEGLFKEETAPLPEAVTFPAPAKEKEKEKDKEKEAKEGEKKGTAAAGGGIDAHLPQVQVPLKSGGGTAKAAENPFGGAEDAALISVDFYKVDLHNVFRLLGEVSGTNIVVAEGVSGTLTLALHEVPWDFALDIILNLKDLSKEKRHNTIVIFPKDKAFVWPKMAAEISFEAENAGDGKGNMITISGEQQQQPEAVEAKQLVTQGVKAEKAGSLETAVQLYEKALNLWPDKVERQEKSKLANKIASIYLTRLNQNAKAVYYAKKALAADKKNSGAALNAAIGHANMEENSQAQQYFDQSISIGTPSRDALFNYAVFSERQRQYDAALRLLGKYSELYGESLDSMVSRARILDQQGRRGEADTVYTAILHAGFSVPQDLRAFILSRTRSAN